MSERIITANRLIDGAVVYRTAHEGWSERLEDGNLLAPEVAEATLAGVQADDVGNVVEPYLIEVGDEGAARPTRYRERIRASGPSVRLDLGKQAAGNAEESN